MYVEQPDVYDEKKVIARKDHVCCECRKPILAGLPYRRIKVLWDGSWSTYKHCMYCVDNAEWYLRVACYPEDGWAYTQLYYEIYETLAGRPDFDMRDCPWPELVFELSLAREPELVDALRQGMEEHNV